MSKSLLPVLSDPAVRERTSAATRNALEERAATPAAPQYLPEDLYRLLKAVVEALLPQAQIGSRVDIAAYIDQRLSRGIHAGWRFADLPQDGPAYQKGLSVFRSMLEQTPMKTFEAMPVAAREGYLRCVANGDVDGPAQFPLSRWLGVLKTDAVRFWLSHPSTMERIQYFGFADGATGETDGPTENEGWQGITPNRTLPFEHGSAERETAEEQA